MNKLFVISAVTIILSTSCETQKRFTSAYNDDVYANPKEERIEAMRVAAIKKQQYDDGIKHYNDSIALIKQAQKAKDDANPYYKDREFKYDDYYDYEYATRIKRFNNNINGLSYYDNYYTNSYWYNQNPYNYGVSVYNGYSWWGPSYNSYSYNPSVTFYSSLGWGNNYGYGGYNGYNPYSPYQSNYWQGYNNGYNQGYNNGWNGYPYYGYGYNGGFGYNPYGYGGGYGYNPYGYGGYGYNNTYNNGWGYYNSYDNNSSYTYGPRSSHGGGNNQRTSNPGVNTNGESYYQKYVNSVVDQQVNVVKFDKVTTPKANGYIGGTIKVDKYGNTPYNGTNIKNQPIFNNSNTLEKNPRQSINDNLINENPTVKDNGTTKNPRIIDNLQSAPVKQQPMFNNDNQPIKQNIDNNIKQYDTKPQYEQQPIRNNDFFQAPAFPSNNGGGGNVPVNNGGHRPR